MELLVHDLLAADGSPQDRLVEHDPQPRRLLFGEQLLTFHAELDPPFDVDGGVGGDGREHLTGVGLGLEQARDQLQRALQDDGGRHSTLGSATAGSLYWFHQSLGRSGTSWSSRPRWAPATL